MCDPKAECQCIQQPKLAIPCRTQAQCVSMEPHGKECIIVSCFGDFTINQSRPFPPAMFVFIHVLLCPHNAILYYAPSRNGSQGLGCWQLQYSCPHTVKKCQFDMPYNVVGGGGQPKCCMMSIAVQRYSCHHYRRGRGVCCRIARHLPPFLGTLP